MIKKTRALAYPGIPIIFAEGFGDYERRISYHNSIGLAITDKAETVRTETVIEVANSKTSFHLDDKPIMGERARGMLRIVGEMSELAGYGGDLKITSYNHNILSGSSDSGAAALVVALNELFGLGLSKQELLDIGHYGSETVFRSLCGGLTEYGVDEGLDAKQIARDLPVSIFAVKFKAERFSADQLHLAVVKHPKYEKRARRINQKITDFKKSLKAGDIPGVLKLMESDAREVHRMFSETGHDVIKPEMEKLCNFVENLRGRGHDCFWNVAGGSCVYVFCPAEERKEIMEELGSRWRTTEYKIAEEAKSL